MKAVLYRLKPGILATYRLWQWPTNSLYWQPEDHLVTLTTWRRYDITFRWLPDMGMLRGMYVCRSGDVSAAQGSWKAGVIQIPEGIDLCR